MHTHKFIHKDRPNTHTHTFLLVQQEVAVLIAASDGVGDQVSVGVSGEDDGNQCVRSGVLTQEGLVTASKGMYSTIEGEFNGCG